MHMNRRAALTGLTVVAFFIGYAVLPICSPQPGCSMRCCNDHGGTPAPGCDESSAPCCEAGVLPAEDTSVCESRDDALRVAPAAAPQSLPDLGRSVDRVHVPHAQRAGTVRLHILHEIFLI
jgi:hypothetical protein